MAKRSGHVLHHATPQPPIARATKANPKRKRTSFESPPGSEISAERYPDMSPRALEFARRMEANPYMREVMRDLADK